MTATSNGEGTGASRTDSAAERWRGIAAVIVAVALLLGFAALLAYLIGKAGTAADGAWSRYVYLFGAAEALVFTAVGWLFGREVNRQAVQSAEARADQAVARVEEATVNATEQEANGRALRAAVETRAGESGVEERGIGGAAGGSKEMRELAALAKALFPDR